MKVFVGASFGRLVVTAIDGKFALCTCSCGRLEGFMCRTGNLSNGTTRSCGCLRREVGQRTKTHGRSGTSIYRTWQQMRNRCTDKDDKSFARYGARGIKVCQRWMDSFEAFLSDMGDRPSPTHTIERKDNDGPYSPENCCWATKVEQTRNRSCARSLTLNGETKPLQDWCDEFGVDYSMVHSRIHKHGWPAYEALTLPRYARINRSATDEMLLKTGLPERNGVAA